MKKENNKKFPGFPPRPTIDFWCYPKAMNGYWHSLNGSEQKVLDYILRHTWGFNKTADEISLSQLKNGIENFDKGTGLSKPTIIKSLRGLAEKGFIKKSNGRKASCYELVKNFNYPSKNSLPGASKKSLHTINNITIKKEQYGSSFKKLRPYFWGQEMRRYKGKWWVILKKGGEWLEYTGKKSEIEWK